MSGISEKYINPLTYFGFKDRVFTKLFEVAEIAKFTPREREAYEKSLKYYRDIKNVVDTSKEEGLREGIEQGIEQGIQKTAAKMKLEGFTQEQIKKITGLTDSEIDSL